ncbi:MAG: hypothetical protein K1000chlam2_01006 [Chlamydiae bacterium]|nr:hypothetical protein [Chlamydiota bacterium]
MTVDPIIMQGWKSPLETETKNADPYDLDIEISAKIEGNTPPKNEHPNSQGAFCTMACVTNGCTHKC